MRGILGAIALLACFSISLSAFGSIDQNKPLRHVLLLSLDSLRADHLPIRGYPRMTAPFLTKLSMDPRVRTYLRMTAVTPSCHPSHTSMLSGLYPQEVGIRSCAKEALFKHSDLDDGIVEERLKGIPIRLSRKDIANADLVNQLRIKKDKELLSKILRDKGFETVGIVSLWPLTSRYGYGHHFDIFDEELPESYAADKISFKALKPLAKWIITDVFKAGRRKPTSLIMSRAMDHLQDFSNRQDSKRLFMFLHISDTHVSYASSDDIHFDHETPEAKEKLTDFWKSRYTKETWKASLPHLQPKKGEKDGLIDMYDRSIKSVDQYLKELFAYMQNTGILDETLVIILGDHGDSMGQHFRPGKKKPFFEHSIEVWEETQDVPLMIFDPRRTDGGLKTANVSHPDIVPTVLHRLGMLDQAQSEGLEFSGENLYTLPEKSRRVHFLTFGRGVMGFQVKLNLRLPHFPRYVGFREGDKKFFIDRKRFKSAKKGVCHYYDLAKDPNEKNNLCKTLSAEEQAKHRLHLVEWYNGTVQGLKAQKKGRNSALDLKP